DDRQIRHNLPCGKSFEFLAKLLRAWKFPINPFQPIRFSQMNLNQKIQKKVFSPHSNLSFGASSHGFFFLFWTIPTKDNRQSNLLRPLQKPFCEDSDL